MNWQIRIQDPTGELRIQPLSASATIGRSASASVLLRDSTAAAEAAALWVRQDDEIHPFWIRVPADAPPAYLGDIPVREASVPAGITVRLGETRLWIEQVRTSEKVPSAPSGIQPWLTCESSGRETLWTAKKAAGTPLSVYLAGETGTGKEVLANLVHGWSERARGPFVPLHCGALPLSLAESELFGHVKGAFTGANQHRSGALMQAHNGTLFLDEVGDLPLDIQVKLLRFLENGEIRPVGADRPSRADVRLVCATHHPLARLVEEGRFRRDLYYRLASVTVEIPSLRSRPKDISLLSRKYAADMGKALSTRALLRLQSHLWPGNVRELRHAVERACALAGPFEPMLGEESFGFLLTHESVEHRPELEIGGTLTLKEMERAMIVKALRISGGNRRHASRILGIARSTLFEMMRRHGFPEGKPDLADQKWSMHLTPSSRQAS